MPRRKKIPIEIKLELLTEAGWRCAVPTCRALLVLDLHHLVEVREGGGDASSNLIALCPTCHSLYHRGHMTRDALYTYKALLVSLSHAFDISTLDDLLYLDAVKELKGGMTLRLSGDGVLHFRRLIAAGLARYGLITGFPQSFTYFVELTPRGTMLLEAWRSGNREKLRDFLEGRVN